jgi:hypothetical protein
VTKLWAALVALALAVALGTGCGGGGGASPTVQPTAAASSTIQPTAQASSTIPPTQQVATSAACQALTSLKSYRYLTNLTLAVPEETVPFPEGQPTPVSTITRDIQGAFYFDYNIDASFIAPDRLDAQISSGTTVPFEVIIIGDNHWVLMEEQWRGSPQTNVAYQPMDICNALFPQLNLDQAQGEKETVNGVAARHYVFPAMPSGETMATIFGAQSDMAILFQTMDAEVWVAEKDGWPVRMDIQGKGIYATGRELQTHIRVELRDINNKDIKIEPPM